MGPTDRCGTISARMSMILDQLTTNDELVPVPWHNLCEDEHDPRRSDGFTRCNICENEHGSLQRTLAATQWDEVRTTSARTSMVLDAMGNRARPKRSSEAHGERRHNLCDNERGSRQRPREDPRPSQPAERYNLCEDEHDPRQSSVLTTPGGSKQRHNLCGDEHDPRLPKSLEPGPAGQRHNLCGDEHDPRPECRGRGTWSRFGAQSLRG